MTSIRMLMQSSVENDLLVHQMDVQTAYLNVPIGCEVYVKQPEGYVVSDKGNKRLVWKLKRKPIKKNSRRYNILLDANNWPMGCLVRPFER